MRSPTRSTMPRRRRTWRSQRPARKFAARSKSASASRSRGPRQSRPGKAARRNSHRSSPIAARKRSTSSKACSAASHGSERGERRDPFGRFVQAFDERELAATRGPEDLAGADADLFQRFQAIGDKTRADHIHLGRAGAREFDERLLGIGLEPLRIAEARLKRNPPLVFAQAQLLS